MNADNAWVEAQLFCDCFDEKKWRTFKRRLVVGEDSDLSPADFRGSAQIIEGKAKRNIRRLPEKDFYLSSL
jgi:hypothetical protein